VLVQTWIAFDHSLLYLVSKAYLGRWACRCIASAWREKTLVSEHLIGEKRCWCGGVRTARIPWTEPLVTGPSDEALRYGGLVDEV
jgi:hypothetical protein